jgi:hypothetical protein
MSNERGTFRETVIIPLESVLFALPVFHLPSSAPPLHFALAHDMEHLSPDNGQILLADAARTKGGQSR